MTQIGVELFGNEVVLSVPELLAEPFDAWAN